MKNKAKCMMRTEKGSCIPGVRQCDDLNGAICSVAKSAFALGFQAAAGGTPKANRKRTENGNGNTAPCELCGQKLVDGYGIIRKAEMAYMQGFARENGLAEKESQDQLRCLWTAYCFHNRLIVDTGTYDNDLMELWSAVPGMEGWSDFDSFDGFMCKCLV